MLKRALCLVAAVIAVAAVLGFTVSPITAARNTSAPRNGTKALRILHVDLMKLAHDYQHYRYRAVCADMTKNERKQLGGTSQCRLKIEVLSTFLPIKKFTITSAKLTKSRSQGTVSLYLNGNKKHLVHADVKWEGGQYRLDHESGWKPKI